MEVPRISENLDITKPLKSDEDQFLLTNDYARTEQDDHQNVSPNNDRTSNQSSPSPIRDDLINIIQTNSKTTDGLNISAKSDNEKSISSNTSQKKQKKDSKFSEDDTVNNKSNSNDSNLNTDALKDKNGIYENPDQISQIADTLEEFTNVLKNSPIPSTSSNIVNKITRLSQQLKKDIDSLKDTVGKLSKNISIDNDITDCGTEYESFPYNFFLLELIVNKIKIKCQCFDMNLHNLMILASFLGKTPVILYDSSHGEIQNLMELNVGRSTIIAMTYDSICNIEKFHIKLEICNQPPCSHNVTKIAETYMDYTAEFHSLRKDLCNRWSQEKPKDEIVCKTSTPLLKNEYYLLSCGTDDLEPIGIIEMTVRMSFLGKEINTIYSKGQNFDVDDKGIAMCSCQKVEIDRSGKILLDEDMLTKKGVQRNNKIVSKNFHHKISSQKTLDNALMNNSHLSYNGHAEKYDEIFTKMNDNQLKIKVPKTRHIENYNSIEDLCTCDSKNKFGDQIQLSLPKDGAYPDTNNKIFSSNFKYTYKGGIDHGSTRPINVTPTDCCIPVNMEKMWHPNKDVFLLKIGKKVDIGDKKTDLEIEFITPKAPLAESQMVSQECSTNKLSETNVCSKKKLKKKSSAEALKKKKSKTKKKPSRKANRNLMKH